MPKKINITNYHECSRGNFTTCALPDTTPDFSSKESKYWHTKLNGEDAVIRHSNHWGQCINCYWTIDGEAPRDKLYRTGIIEMKQLSFNRQAVERIKNLLQKLPEEERRKLAETVLNAKAISPTLWQRIKNFFGCGNPN